MIGQITQIGGAWGSAARAIDGALAVDASIGGWWAARHAWVTVRPWWAALSTVWMLLGTTLLAGSVGLVASSWVPWITHGILIVCSVIIAGFARSAVRGAHDLTRTLTEAMDE